MTIIAVMITTIIMMRTIKILWNQHNSNNTINIIIIATIVIIINYIHIIITILIKNL